MSENNHAPAPFQVSIDLGGRPLILETGKIAKQANGAVTARYGDTIVLVSACMANKPNDRDFLPLTVDYRENTYSAGKIPGGFFKREGRPTEKEILVSRLIDRPMRPLFPDSWRNETQVIALVLSADSDNDPDVIAVTAASAAAYCSDLPFTDPIAAVRVGLLDGKLVANPTVADQKVSKLNIVIAGTADGIVMVESGAFEVSEDKVVEALEFGHEQVKKIVAGIKQLHDQIKPKKVVVEPLPFDQAIYDNIKKTYGAKLQDALNTEKHPKKESYHLVDALKDEIVATVPEEDEEKLALTKRAFERLREDIFRQEVLKAKRRPDGRAFDQIRKITCEAGLLPRVHGSALFTRGETQALATLTLGTKEDMQRLDLLFEQDTFKRFMLHYNFPPFSVGEVKFLRGPGRREIGHGALAERALREMLPAEDAFPYTVRIVSDILESNGSSSMASICGGTLALMDAGVPVKSPVAGVAMGLVKEAEKWAVLSDIAGEEDHYGDMDFKVAGTRQGITALQMDIKISGITAEILEKALEQARQGRMYILDKMAEAIQEPRPSISAYAPRILTIKVPVDKIRDIIGPGGKMIRSIVERTGCKIDVEDDGRVSIASVDEAAAKKAVAIIEELTATAELNKTYLGKVVRVVDFGAFVEILPGTDGLLHVSEMAHHRVQDVRSEVKEGDQILVKVVNIEPGSGKIRLSRKALLAEGEGGAPAEATAGAPASGGREHRGGGEHRDRGHRGG